MLLLTSVGVVAYNIWSALHCHLTLAQYSFARAATRHASPAAEEAKPAPVGKVLTDDICTWYNGQSSLRTMTAPEAGSTRSWASFLISRRQVTPRPLISISVSFNHRRSWPNSLLAATVVIVCRSAWCDRRIWCHLYCRMLMRRREKSTIIKYMNIPGPGWHWQRNSMACSILHPSCPNTWWQQLRLWMKW